MHARILLILGLLASTVNASRVNRIIRNRNERDNGEMMIRDELGGFPFEVERNDSLIIIRFYPRSTAKYPDQSVLTLKIDKKSKEKLLKILAEG